MALPVFRDTLIKMGIDILGRLVQPGMFQQFETWARARITQAVDATPTTVDNTIEDVVNALLTPDVEHKLKVALCSWLKAEVKNTANQIDDAIVTIVIKAMGVSPGEVA